MRSAFAYYIPRFTLLFAIGWVAAPLSVAFIGTGFAVLSGAIEPSLPLVAMGGL